MEKFTIDDYASYAFYSTHTVASNQTILSFILREDSWDRQRCSLAIKTLLMFDGFVVKNFSIFFPEDVWLGSTFNVALQSNCISVAAAQILQVLSDTW
jgi:hypothetical protein